MKSNVMKVLMGALVLLGLSLNVNAQEKKVEFGVKAGLNLSTMSGEVDNNVSKKSRVGFNAGLTLDFNLTENVALLTGLEYTGKGLKLENNESKNTGTISLNYLQLPLHFGYKLVIAENTKLVLHAGPYLAYGLKGTNKSSYKGETVKIDLFKKQVEEDSKGNEYEVDAPLKRFDMGLGLGAKVEFGKLSLGLGYDLGLLNLNNDKSLDDNGKELTISNRNLYLSAGFKF